MYTIPGRRDHKSGHLEPIVGLLYGGMHLCDVKVSANMLWYAIVHSRFGNYVV